MKKRYQVFVSSTFVDLQEERNEVMQALLELDCIPAGMELFPASNDDQWTLIKNVIDDCDYYIVTHTFEADRAVPSTNYADQVSTREITEDSFKWERTANWYWLGHDLMWIMATLRDGTRESAIH